MPRKPKKYWNAMQLKQGIQYELQYCENPNVAKEIAIKKLTQYPTTYRRLPMLIPILHKDLVKQKRKLRKRAQFLNQPGYGGF